MTPLLFIVFILGFAIAYVNGANDVSKGVATLVGSGITDFRRAILWGTLWTGIGGVSAALLARAMVYTFGKGMLASGTQVTLGAALATIAGAALWVGIATRKGLPVSTTHAIVGSVAGVGFVAYGLGRVNWSVFGGKIVLPLLVSPLASLLITATILRVWRALARGSVADCICAQVAQPMVLGNELALANPSIFLPQVHIAACTARQNSSSGLTLDHLHWLTSGATSFSRGLNDAPKMVAIVMSASLLAGSGVIAPIVFFVAIGIGMVAGSWIAGRRVTEVLACKLTVMDHRQGFIANLVTAALVGPGAALGLPMSTTHVASGAIIGVASDQPTGANNKTVRGMLLAWVVTVPAAALLGVAAFLSLGLAGVK